MQKNWTETSRQGGAVMMVTLVFLVVLGVMALTSMGSTRLELKMSSNDSLQTEAHQVAQALIDAIIANPAMTPVIGTEGFTICTPGQAGCNMQSIFMPAGPLAGEVGAGRLSANAQLVQIGNPPPGIGYSADEFLGNYFTVNSTYDATNIGQGRASITQGIIVLTQKPN